MNLENKQLYFQKRAYRRQKSRKFISIQSIHPLITPTHQPNESRPPIGHGCGHEIPGVAQNLLYWHHSSLNLSKKIGFFPFNWVPENPTRGPRGIDLKRENTKSIIMITNLICWLLIVVVNSQGLISPP